MPRGVNRCAGCAEPVEYGSAIVVHRRAGFEDGAGRQKTRLCGQCFGFLADAGDPRVSVRAEVATTDPVRDAVAEIVHDARRRAELAHAPELPPELP